MATADREPTEESNRAQQRRRSEERILTAARDLFADVGFDRTTIRAVAASAGVDAGLVMHYFGSKAELFARAAQTESAAGVAESPLVAPATPEEVVEALVASLGTRLDGEPASSLALLRSMLTNADAAERYRAAAVPELGRMAAALPGTDAELRAALLGAVVHGVIIERYLLRMSRLADADPERVLALLRPCLEALATAGDESADEEEDESGG